MKRRKVLWLSHLVPYPPQGLGALQRAYHLLHQASKYHDVYLVAFVQSQLITQMFGDIEVGLAVAQRELLVFCKKVAFVSIPSDGSKWGKRLLAFNSLFRRTPYTINWLKSKEMVSLLGDWGRQIEFDTIHFDTISLAPYLANILAERKVLDHHNVESDMMIRRASNEPNLIKRAYFLQEGKRLRRFEQHACPLFDVNVTCSKLDSERLLAIVPSARVTEIPNGVDIEYFDPKNFPVEQKTNSLVFAGNMTWYPNREAMRFLLEEVWPLLKLHVPNASVDIIGANPPADIVLLARKCQDVHIHGFVKDVRPYIAQAQLYVCPIRDGGGTKLKILDALAMGKAIIAHPIACEGIGVTPNVNIMFASNPQEYVNTIQLLFNNSMMRKKQELAARALAVSEYSYESIGRRLAELF
jgi:polysaccharide biosynthesis protein PslH